MCPGGLWNKRQGCKWKLNEKTDGEREGVQSERERRKKVVENFESDNKIQLYSFFLKKNKLFAEKELQGRRTGNKQSKREKRIRGKDTCLHTYGATP